MFKQFLRVLKQPKLNYSSLLDCNINYVSNRVQISLFNTSSISRTKVLVENENSYAFNSLRVPQLRKELSDELFTKEDFNEFTGRKWRGASGAEITLGFSKIVPYCKKNLIPLSDRNLDNLTDGLMDCVEKLTDEQISDMLDILREFPPCLTFKSHNLNDIWSALDDICCWRMRDWDNERIFEIGDKWYSLGLGRVCDYVHEIIGKFANKPNRLTVDELVHVFFYLNVTRKHVLNFEYESAVESKIDEMTLDQMGIIAMGYFKSQNKVKIPGILSAMMQKVKDTKDGNEIPISAIMKIVRYSGAVKLPDQIYDFMNVINDRLDGFTTLAALHAALIGTTIQLEHKPLLKKAAQKIAENIHDVKAVRVKDIERILLPLAMFDYNPETRPDIFKASIDEFLSEKRQIELRQYPRCLGAALLYLSTCGFYSYPLMDKILDSKYREETYGKVAHNFPREIFSLDRSIEIDCPDYKGNRVPLQDLYRAAKRGTTFAPHLDYRKTVPAVDRIYIDVVELIKTRLVNGDVSKMPAYHVLPHFSRPDLILCRNRRGEFVTPTGFENYILGDVMRPHEQDADQLDYYAVVVIGWNNTIRNTSRIVGMTAYKLRQLRTIGYKPIQVIWNEYLPLKSDEKLDYIRKQF